MKASILIVDDEESIRFSFHRFLAAEGHNVFIAASYLEALARMHEMRFDLILTDVILDDGWGIDILYETKRRNLKTCVIIMTAYPTVETVRASIRMQANGYLIKPLGQEDLLHSVSNALEQLRRGEDEGSDPVGKEPTVSGDS